MDATERVKHVLAQLPRDDQLALAEYLNEILVTEEEAEALLASERVVATVTAGRPKAASKPPTVTYREERVKCGKKGCTKCPHGPYVYKYWREDGRLRKRYVGKPNVHQTRIDGTASKGNVEGAPPA